MASRQAVSRLQKEHKALSKEPVPYIHVAFDEANILEWSFVLEGPADTPYVGGWYWGRLRFPKNYPFAPPAILMMTPNGRFQTNMRLCLSMSDYHPETWQPAWSVGTVLQGLLSFMCEEAPTTGALDPPPSAEERQRLASASWAWNLKNPDFQKYFPEPELLRAEAHAAETGGHDMEKPDQEATQKPQEPPEVPSPIGAPKQELLAAFPVGSVVRIHSLQGARSDLNNQEGVVKQATEGRYHVVLGSEKVSIRATNLELVRHAPGDVAAGPSHREQLPPLNPADFL